MSLPIISADQRLQEKRGIKGVLLGGFGVGKTSLLYSLPVNSTLFFDLEAGDLAVQEWGGDTIRPKTWAECRDFAVFIGGPNPALADEQVYSQAHYDAVCEKFGDPSALDKYETIFIDSITVAGRLCFQWSKQQPQSFSDKTGKPDIFLLNGQWYSVGGDKNKPIHLLAAGERTICLAAADDWLNDNETADSAHKSQSWLNQSATEKQLQYLPAEMQMDYGLTRYKASALLSFKFNKHAIRKLVYETSERQQAA